MPRSLLILLIFIFFNSYSQPKLPAPDHIVIVILENKAYQQIIGSPDAPNINKLAKDSATALFTQSYAITYPSQPNYLCLFSGSNQGVEDGNIPKNIPFITPNLGSQLLKAGKTYVSYAEDLPYEGYNEETYKKYVRRHNPAAFWMGTGPNQLPPSVIQPLTAFPKNFNLLPTVCYVIPNNDNNMHDGPIDVGDKMFYDFLSSYIEWAKTHNSLFILTFDEDNREYNNQIVTLFTGEMVKAGKYSKRIDHYSVLRTIEDMYGLPPIANAAAAEPITNCWKDNYPDQDDWESNAITVYSNPSDHTLTLEIDEKVSLTGLKFRITNIKGAKLKEIAISSTKSTIYLPEFSNGMYVYQVVRNKDIVKSDKLIIK